MLCLKKARRSVNASTLHDIPINKINRLSLSDQHANVTITHLSVQHVSDKQHNPVFI